jgi:glycosyltransferase involved in cell wall biosynthesis
MPDNLQVTLTTISRFHIFEMAAQLERTRSLAAIYTGLARHFVRSYPIAPKRIRPFPWLQTPLEAAQRLELMPKRWAEKAGWHAKQALDRHVARTLQPSHVYCALSGAGLVSGAVAQAQGAAYVCYRNSTHILSQDQLLRQEYQDLGLPYAGIDPRIVDKECAEYEAADAVLVPSAFVRKSFVAQGVAPEKIHSIPLGVNTKIYEKRSPRDERFRILFVGQLSVRKGLHYRLQATRLADLKDATLVLVGAEQPETQSLLTRFPVASVEITGPLSRAEVADQMSRASVFVLPSIEEGLSLVMAEALACGCPVVASENTGATDLYRDGEEGAIVPVGDIDALAQNLIRLYDDPELRDAMAQRAVARVRQLGGWDSFGTAVLHLFQKLAGEAGHDVTVPRGSTSAAQTVPQAIGNPLPSGPVEYQEI